MPSSDKNSFKKWTDQKLMDAKVLLKSQLKLGIPVEDDHWMSRLNYRVHLDEENGYNAFIWKYKFILIY